MGLDATPVDLGRYGVWLRHQDLDEDVAAEVERLGFGTLWLGGSPSADLEPVATALAATSRLAVATGIVNIWAESAEEAAEAYGRLESAYPGRFLLGIGAGHREVDGPEAVTPLRGMRDYLDVLDRGGVPADRRVLAALGPRMLELSAERAAGAHPYLVNPAHTRMARGVLGDGPLLAPEHKLVLGADPEVTRRQAREGMSFYLGIHNYAANLERLGFSEADLADGGSDALIDDLVARGGPEEAAALLRTHLDAGADHVVAQPLPGECGLLGSLARLAPALIT
ncbi:TIGR03620 family F420-dependent LLM class oxidoreductase [Nocardiopsis exhalans]|uniref:TIGR03620 family F420-dependent LLM class oxidoreductase n=1 Tax=Nocardiopsis exhalans TaxID=163604 RepID=A0ABY5D2E7_9ACTN|nr:TIGR03620 family F420-dependent LLM class oxidoreductase [Nocardiopsis exhalans]USY18494.1 TIGR03620 family F420-dependent LLM class oxidoreductase [Nocardiopsis exhalans]